MDKKCKHDAGIMIPVVDLAKCEAKGPCVEVCPYDVFEIQKISKSDFAKLPFIAKIKTLVHRSEKAYVVQPNACMACGLCITACPEKAISLVKVLANESFN
jgi:4Fe-4S ferredoxin